MALQDRNREMKDITIGDQIPRRSGRISQWIAVTAMRISGWKIEAAIPNIPKFILVGAPHTSNWDFVLTMLTKFALEVRISWMAKHSLFRWPFKRILEGLGGIPVNRDLKNAGVVEQTIELFKNRDKLALAIMPEGTRAKVMRWKSGFYHIAEGAKVPMVMVRFDYARRVIGIGPTFNPTGELAADLPLIQAIFASIQGKNPRQF